MSRDSKRLPYLFGKTAHVSSLGTNHMNSDDGMTIFYEFNLINFNSPGRPFKPFSLSGPFIEPPPLVMNRRVRRRILPDFPFESLEYRTDFVVTKNAHLLLL